MSTLRNTPRSHTVLMLEARKSYAFGLNFLTEKTKTPIDVTGATTRMTVANPARKGGAVLFTETAAEVDAATGKLLFELQAADLDLAEDEYPFAITLTTPLGYSTLVMKGVLALQDNVDPNSANTYNGLTPGTEVTAYLRQGDVAQVVVETLSGMAVDYANADPAMNLVVTDPDSSTRATIAAMIAAETGPLVSETELATTLFPYVTDDELTGTLAGYTSDAELTTALADYTPRTGRPLVATDAPYNAVGNGVADDTAALNAFIAACANQGREGIIPAGTYRFTAQLGTADKTKAFTIRGAGKYATVLKRAADFTGPAIQISRTDNWLMEGFTVDGGATEFPTNASHGLVAMDCSFATFRNIDVRNWKNSAILVYSTTASKDADFLIENCNAYGLGAASNNGILYAEMERSFIRNCNVRDILGSPGIGLQLKNDCINCGIINGQAINCDDGFSFGGDTVGKGPRRNLSANLVAIDCNYGLAIGESYNNVFNGVLIDARGKATANSGIHLETDSRDATITGVQMLNIPQAAIPLRIQGVGSTVDLDYVENDGTDELVNFASTADRNIVSVRRAIVNGASMTEGHSTVVWGGTTTNSYDFLTGSNIQRITIAGDAATLNNRRASVLHLSTEGATATDNLNRIIGGVDGQVLVLRTLLDTQDVTVLQVSQSGGIVLAGGASMVLDNARDSLTVMYVQNADRWVELARANNGA